MRDDTQFEPSTRYQQDHTDGKFLPHRVVQEQFLSNRARSLASQPQQADEAHAHTRRIPFDALAVPSIKTRQSPPPLATRHWHDMASETQITTSKATIQWGQTESPLRCLMQRPVYIVLSGMLVTHARPRLYCASQSARSAKKHKKRQDLGTARLVSGSQQGALSVQNLPRRLGVRYRPSIGHQGARGNGADVYRPSSAHQVSAWVLVR